MNLNMFDNMSGYILRERENTPCPQLRPFSNRTVSGIANSDVVNGNCNPNAFPANTPLAMAYVPVQQWKTVYNEDEAFAHGTLFPELNLPFERGGSR